MRSIAVGWSATVHDGIPSPLEGEGGEPMRAGRGGAALSSERLALAPSPDPR